MRRRCLTLVIVVGLGLPALAQEPAQPPEQQTLSPAARGEDLYRIGDDLISTRWRLERMEGRPVAGGTAPTLEFLRDLQIRGSTGCGRYVGPFASRADKGAFGPFRVSRGDCEGSLREQERSYLTRLEQGWLMELDAGKDALLVYPERKGGEPLRFVRLR